MEPDLLALLTPAEREALARAEAALEGPWESIIMPGGSRPVIVYRRDAPGRSATRADMVLMQHASTDVPALARALAEARAAAEDRLHDAVQFARQWTEAGRERDVARREVAALRAALEHLRDTAPREVPQWSVDERGHLEAAHWLAVDQPDIIERALREAGVP